MNTKLNLLGGEASKHIVDTPRYYNIIIDGYIDRDT